MLKLLILKELPKRKYKKLSTTALLYVYTGNRKDGAVLMHILESVRNRKSIRGFKQDPVPREIIKEVLDIATRAPSAMNTQPWEFTVVAGDVLDHIRQGNMEQLLSGAAGLKHYHSNYQGVYRKRQVELAVEIFKLMGIAREDSIKREAWTQRGFRFFDAPAAIIISSDTIDGAFVLFDIGAVTQTICLVALNYGLGTCIGIQGAMFPEVIRKYAGIPDCKKIIISIAIGYPDDDFPANKLISRREPVDNITNWVGFTD